MDRRTYMVTVAGVTGIAGMAGCLGDDDDTDSPESDGLGVDTGDIDDTTDDTGDTTDESADAIDDTGGRTDDSDETFDGTTGPSEGWPDPGDEPTWSRNLRVGLYGTYQIEDGERHYFNVQLSDGDKLTATMYFDHDDGDLNLELLDADENVVDSSTSDTDDETVSVRATADDVYYVVPYGSSGVTNQYDIDIEY